MGAVFMGHSAAPFFGRFMTEIEELNSRIGAEYMTIDGRVMFRLVWSEEIFENRYGTFREFTSEGIFVREVTEVRRTRKYNYIHNRWIFEMWAGGNLVANPETPDAVNGDYVPVYVFEDKHGGYLPPNERVVRFLIAALEGKIRRDIMPSQEYLEEKEVDRMVESMDDHPSWFQTRPGDARNAIWYKGGVPQWEHRRATFTPALEHEEPLKRSEIVKAKIFQEELQEIEALQEQKRNIRQEIKREEQVIENQETRSPSHK